MTLAAGLVLIAAVFLIVAWPFFRKTSFGAAGVVTSATLDHWERQKAEAYAAIKDAELDFQTGKMSQMDFQFVRDKYAARALEAIAALDESSRAAPGGRPPGGIRYLYCPGCGNELPPRARFCPGCGRGLHGAADAA